MARPLTASDVAQRAPDRIAAEIGEETVILDISSGHYFQLNKLGTRIWGLIEAPLSIAGICARLEAAFDVDHATCRREVIAFLETLRDNGLVEVRTGDAPIPPN